MDDASYKLDELDELTDCDQQYSEDGEDLWESSAGDFWESILANLANPSASLEDRE